MTIHEIRSRFPALKSSTTFLENAGGSQVPIDVIEAISKFYVEAYAQTGVDYPESVLATESVDFAHRFMNEFFNGAGLGDVVFGSSTTALFYLLGQCLAEKLKPGDEVIIANNNHESHIGPWVRLERKGVRVNWWKADAESGMMGLSGLKSLLNDKVKLVCVTQTCNLTGDRLDIRAVCALAHSFGAQVIVDCVAAAPHELPDVAQWEVDFACVSLYKIYGPHMGALWGRSESWEALDGPNHFFLPRIGGKPFEIGCLPYEFLAGLRGLTKYFADLGGGDGTNRKGLEMAYRRISELEAPLVNMLQEFLESRQDVRILGPQRGEMRHPTFSFVHDVLSSSDIVERVLAAGFAIRFGHMYAYRLCEHCGISLEDGVVRISAVHYNSAEEIEGLCGVLEQIFDSHGEN